MNVSSLFSSSWGILMVVLFFGGSIFVHELGHFLAAKWRGLHIERFSIGFGPKIIGWRRGGVEYRLSWLPLGGYVALPQLADMRGVEGGSSIDHKALPPISYADKVIVAVAGAVFNIIFAAILASILFYTGRPSSAEQASTEIGHLSETLVNVDGDTVPAPARAAGLQVGDIIKSIDGRPIRSWANIHEAIALSYGKNELGERAIDFTIERDSEILHFEVNPILSKRNEIRQVGIAPGYKTYIRGVYPNSPVDKAGIKPGDALLAIDSTPIRSPATYAKSIEHKVGQAITLILERDGEPYEAVITPVEKVISKDGETRAMTGIYRLVSAPDLIHQTPWEQLKEIFAMTLRTLRSLTHANSDIGIKQMSGPVDIANILYELARYDMLTTLWFVTIINVSLAVFNLLPIPVLDGGHIAFATIAKLRGKPLNPNFIASTQGSFMILLFGLMIYITYHNISRIARDRAERKEFEENAVSITFEDPVPTEDSTVE